MLPCHRRREILQTTQTPETEALKVTDILLYNKLYLSYCKLYLYQIITKMIRRPPPFILWHSVWTKKQISESCRTEPKKFPSSSLTMFCSSMRCEALCCDGSDCYFCWLIRLVMNSSALPKSFCVVPVYFKES